MNKRTRRVEEPFNLSLNDYYVKRVEHEFPQKPTLSNSNGESEQMPTFDIDYNLFFGIPDNAIDDAVNIK